jgi:hypothetical protein
LSREVLVLGPSFSQLWLEELKTTKVKQQRFFLNYNDTHFCSLGVACELFRQRLGLVKRREADGLVSYDGCIAAPPDKLVRALRLQEAPVSIESLNDAGVSFASIAKKLERFRGVYFDVG